MKCDLMKIVLGLKQEFSVEFCGDIDRRVRAVEKLSDTVLPIEENVLYITDQSNLLRYTGAPAKGAVLCISHTDWDLRNSQPLFPALIKVLCKEPERVYVALNQLFFQEGTKVSDMPEISGAFLHSHSLEALVEKGYEYLKNPFAIHDGQGKLLAYSGQDCTEEQDGTFLERIDLCSAENSHLMERSRYSQTPILISPRHGPQQLRMALCSRGQILGYLTVLAEYHSFSDQDVHVTELLGCFVTLDLLRQSTIPRINMSHAGRLKGFLESGQRNIPGMPQWLKTQQCESGEWFYLVLINASPQRGMPFWDSDVVLRQLDTLFPEDISTRTEAGVVLLLKTVCVPMRDERFVSFCSGLGTEFVLAVSNPFSSLSASAHAAMRQVRLTLELATTLDPDKQCYTYQEYAVYAGIRAASGQIDLRELLVPGLSELLEGDSGGEMLRTLECYLSTGGRKARAAELLFIHLNTLKYRLGQIAQKLHVDLDDPATLYSLRYSLHVLRYMKAFHP